MVGMREQLLDAGMRLFGERGYAATSVADIQLACGLTGGSGALYKHFPSKRALLAEGVHRYVAGLEKSRSGLLEVLPDEPTAALRVIGEAVFAAMASDRSMIRIGLRDLADFPDLLDVLWEGLMSALYRELAAWLQAQGTAGKVAVADSAATAAVLVGSLTYYRVLDALIGHRPGDVEAAAYLSAWVDSAVATVHPRDRSR
jgi:AcrR family transcriptional regulator